MMHAGSTLSSADSGWASRRRVGSGETNRVLLLAARARDHLGGVVRTAVYRRVSAPLGDGFVLVNNAGGDAPAGADRDALVFGPCADTAAALTARCGPVAPLPGLAGVVDEGNELPPGRGGVLGAQIDLAAAYFPGPLAALRTLNSDVIIGLDPATVADLDATGQPWRTDGSHGLIQVRCRIAVDADVEPRLLPEPGHSPRAHRCQRRPAGSSPGLQARGSVAHDLREMCAGAGITSGS
jgi:hypothetical protein